MITTRSIHSLLIYFALCTCVGLLFSCQAHAGDKRLIDAQHLSRLFEKFIAADSPFPGEDLKVSNFTSRPDTLELPPGEIEYLFDMGAMTGRLGLRTFYLDVLVNGLQVERVKMSGTVQLYGNVLSAARTLKRGSILTRQDLKQSRRNISMLGANLAQAPILVIGKQLKTTLQPGSILFTSLLKTPQIVKRGDIVTILADSGQIHISVPGKARSAGALGDTIKVKNMLSRREIYAKIINQDEVQVEF